MKTVRNPDGTTLVEMDGAKSNPDAAQIRADAKKLRALREKRKAEQDAMIASLRVSRPAPSRYPDKAK